MKSTFILILTLLLFPLLPAQAAPLQLITTQSANISNRAYFPAVHNEFQNAKQSIVVAIYLIRVYPDSKPSSPTRILVQDLIDASKRGVKVRVIFGNTFRRDSRTGRMRLDRGNDTAAEMLTAGGVEVRYAAGSDTLHHKAIVIDGETTIYGSTNWSDSALSRNKEVSGLHKSKEYAADILATIEETELQPVGAGLPRPPSESVPIPLRLITDKDLLPKMVSGPDNRSFDLFLLLWRRYLQERKGARNQITVELEPIASELGIDTEKASYRSKTLRTMRKLRDRYSLIKYESRSGGPATVSFVGAASRRPPFSIKIPIQYWNYKWPSKLNLSTKALYLICIAEAASSENNPWWQRSLDNIAEKYTLKRFTVNQALRELEHQELLEIKRNSVPPGGTFAQKSPNAYRLKDMVAPDVIRKEWETLDEAHGKEMLEKARECAAEIERENSRDITRKLLDWIGKYGLEKVQAAAKKTGKMWEDNPYRHVGYILYLLKKQAKEK